MPTSGTYTFTTTRNELIESAFRLIGVFGTGEPPATADYTNASQALNFMIKSWMKKDILLWTVQNIAFPTVVGQTNYLLGTGGVTTIPAITYRPLRIIEAYIKDSSGNDVTLNPISRQEYLQYGNKISQGVPNSYYYDKQLTTGVIYVYTTASDTTHNIHLAVQRPLQDMTNSTDNFDFPIEWVEAIKYGLATRLSREYGYSTVDRESLKQEAEQYLEDAVSWDQEDTSVYFTYRKQ